MSYRVLDVSLANEGRRKIQWASSHMPVLQSLTRQYEKDKPLEGIRVAGCLHVTKETAVLVESLKVLGAELSWCGCNPLSTQDGKKGPGLQASENMKSVKLVEFFVVERLDHPS